RNQSEAVMKDPTIRTVDRKDNSMRRTCLRLLLALVAVVTHVPSATSEDSDRYNYPKGLVLETPEDLKDIPRVPTFRDYLPDRVDLSRHFPRPGKQKNGSCTAWAVGYAARAFYANVYERRNIKDSLGNTNGANVPSPAYIYRAALDDKQVGPCEDRGISIPSALKLLNRSGALPLREMPEIEGLCTPVPVGDFSDFRILDWLVIARK